MLAERYRKELEKRVSRQKEGDRGVIGETAVKRISSWLETYSKEELESEKRYTKLANQLDELGQYRTSKMIRLIAETEKTHSEILADIAKQLRIQLW